MRIDLTSIPGNDKQTISSLNDIPAMDTHGIKYNPLKGQFLKIIFSFYRIRRDSRSFEWSFTQALGLVVGDPIQCITNIILTVVAVTNQDGTQM